MQGLGNSVEDIQTIYSFIWSPPPPALFAIFSSWLAGPCGCWNLKFIRAYFLFKIVFIQFFFTVLSFAWPLIWVCHTTLKCLWGDYNFLFKDSEFIWGRLFCFRYSVSHSWPKRTLKNKKEKKKEISQSPQASLPHSKKHKIEKTNKQTKGEIEKKIGISVLA